MSVTGSLAHSLTDHSVDLAGASGGGYALIGAHLAAVVTVSIADSGYLDRDCTRVDGRSTGGGSSITLIFTVHSPPCMAIRVSQINWNFIEFFFSELEGDELQMLGRSVLPDVAQCACQAVGGFNHR